MSANVYGVLDRVADGWRKAAGMNSTPRPQPVSVSTPSTFTSALQAGTAPGMRPSNIPIPEPTPLPDITNMYKTNSFGGVSGIPDIKQLVSRHDSPLGFLPSFSEIQEQKRAKKAFEEQGNWGSGEGNYDTGEGRGLSGVKQWDSQIRAAAQQFGLPWEVIASIMGIESGGDPRVTSVAGARGLMQIMPEYWQYLADQYDGNLTNPETNIKVGAQILKILYDKYGSWDKAAAAYLGAIDANGNITSAADAYGTTGYTYVDLFNQNMRALGYGAPSQAEAAAGGQPATHQAYNAMQFVMDETIGVPYVWGGADMNGFDCSGLTLWAFAKAGIQLPRTAEGQYYATQRIDHNQVQPGDLVFFSFPSSSVNSAETSTINHVAIYIGNGQIVHATSNGDIVRVASLNDSWYAQHIYGYGRAF